MESVYKQFQINTDSTKMKSLLGTSTFRNLKIEQDAPIFSKLRINFNPSHPITHLVTNNNHLILVMSNKILVRIDLLLPNDKEEIDLSKFSNPQSKIHKLFFDPTGQHLIISIIRKDSCTPVDVLYLPWKSSMPKVSNRLKDILITAVGWNHKNKSESSTGQILLDMTGMEIGLLLLNELPTKIQRQCIETLIIIFRNVHSNPGDTKYRRLKLSNKRFNDEVWQYEGAKMVLYSSGWKIVEDNIQLPAQTDVSDILTKLIENRNVKPSEAEWVEENKLIGLSPARIREEELKCKALKDKEKEMANLKKDMAERKAIADRIVKEHRNDLKTRRATQPSKASPLPSASGASNSAKMSNNISSQG